MNIPFAAAPVRSSVPTPMKAQTSRKLSLTKFLALSLGLSVAGMSSPLAQAADVIHNVSTDSSTWSGATWSNGTPGNNPGDVATNSQSGGVTVTGMVLDVPVTIGAFQNGGSGGRSFTLNSDGTHVLTLDGTGISATNNGFSEAGIASIRNTATGGGTFTINPDIILATSTDIGGSSTGLTTIGGNTTASTTAALKFLANASGQVTVSGSIGASGGNIAITSQGTGGGAVNLNGALGSSVTSLTQNTTTSALNLNGVSSSFAGTLSIAAGTVNIGSAAQLGASGVYAGSISNAGTLNYNSSADQTFSGAISGTGVITKAGGTGNNGSTLTLSGANIYTGATTITNGTVAGIGAHAFGSSSSITVGGSGILSLRGDASTSFTKASDSTGYSITTTGSSATIDVDQATAAGSGARTMTIGSLGTTSSAASYGFNFTGANNTGLTIGMITGAASTAAGTVTLTNNNTSGTTTINGYTSANTGGGDTLAVAGSGNTTINAVLANGATALAFTKSGTGTATLTSSSSYTGTTKINAGKLQLANATGSATGAGDVVLSGGSGATLAGTGYSSGNTTVTAGSRIAAGMNTTDADGSGRNNFGAAETLSLATTAGKTLTLSNVNFDFDLAGTAAGTSDLVTADTLSLGSTVAFNFNGLSGGTLQTGAAYTLINANSITGFNANNITTNFLGALGGQYTATYSTNATNDLQVTFNAVPEPTTWAMMVGGFGMLVGFQRSRRRRS